MGPNLTNQHLNLFFFYISVDCGQPPALANGYIAPGSTVYGTIRIVFCYEFFILPSNALPQIRCENNGRWSTTPECLVLEYDVPTTEPAVARQTTTTSSTTSPTTTTTSTSSTTTTSTNSPTDTTTTTIVLTSTPATTPKPPTLRIRTTTAASPVDLIPTTPSSFPKDTESFNCTHCRSVNQTLSDDLVTEVQLGNARQVEQLLNQCADVNSRFESKTALMLAAEQGDVEVLKQLLKCNANVTLKSNTGSTALIYSALNGNIEIFNHLVNASADINAVNDKGTNALIMAATNGHIQVVRLLVGRTNVNVRNEEGKTPLLAAAFSGYVNVVRILLDKGANVDDEFGMGTSLMLAVQRNYVEMVQVLIEHGANVNFSSRTTGNSVLHIAVKKGYIAIVEALLNAGASKFTLNNERENPIDIAREMGNEQIINLLTNSWN